MTQFPVLSHQTYRPTTHGPLVGDIPFSTTKLDHNSLAWLCMTTMELHQGADTLRVSDQCLQIRKQIASKLAIYAWEASQVNAVQRWKQSNDIAKLGLAQVERYVTPAHCGSVDSTVWWPLQLRPYHQLLTKEKKLALSLGIKHALNAGVICHTVLKGCCLLSLVLFPSHHFC